MYWDAVLLVLFSSSSISFVRCVSMETSTGVTVIFGQCFGRWIPLSERRHLVGPMFRAKAAPRTLVDNLSIDLLPGVCPLPRSDKRSYSPSHNGNVASANQL